MNVYTQFSARTNGGPTHTVDAWWNIVAYKKLLCFVVVVVVVAFSFCRLFVLFLFRQVNAQRASEINVGVFWFYLSVHKLLSVFIERNCRPTSNENNINLLSSQ